MKPIWPWLFPACVVAAALYIAYANYPWWNRNSIFQSDKWFFPAMGTILTVLVGGLSCALGCAISEWIGGRADWKWERGWSAQMVSMRGADGVAGSVHGGVFILSGHIESAHTYFYYTLNADGSFQPHKWKADLDTAIHEEDRKDGNVVQWSQKLKHPWVEWLGCPGDRYHMDFYIPKGSLKQSFQLE